MKTYEKILDEVVGTPRCELDFENNFELLIAVVLSAQCTDKRVNLVTKTLFKKYPNAETLANASVQDVAKEIYSLGFYNSKAKNIVSLAKDLVEKFGGKVPCTMEKLTNLSGVGRKTASVVLAEGFGKPAIAVDTHVFRVANRLGIGSEKSPYDCEMALKKRFPKSSWGKVHLQMVHFGRYHCKAKNPSCNACKFQKICLYYNKKKD
ncbi:MAG: endonuclease III [Clostridia bacterium]|nr:endonuclease III [Clostridia bacterium]MBR5226967.1 endonuclease III [Clostridia bacterium]